MSDAVTVIDIVAQVTDETSSGTRSASENVSKLEKAMMNLQRQIMGMRGKSKLEVAATLKDMATKGIEGVASAGKKIAGKVWTVTMKAKDLVTAPFKKVWGLVSSPIASAAAFAGITVGAADTINTFKDFQAAMSQVQAVSGATGTEFEKLTAKAKKMGASTQFTAKESADAFNYMAMAGWKTGDMLNGIEGIMNLAAAAGEDLATTSDIVTDAMTAFGLAADGTTKVIGKDGVAKEVANATHFADVLAAASSNANTNVGMMGETFKYVAPVAGAMGYSIEDSAIAIGLMANNGIKASQGGTALRSIITRLSTDAGASSKKLGALGTLTKKLGVEFYNTDGSARGLNDVLSDARVAWQGLSKEQQASYGKVIAGQEAMSGWLALMNSTPKDIEKVTDAIVNCDRASADMARTMNDNLSGSFTYLQSAVDGVKIAVGERLSPYVKDFVDWLTGKMPGVQAAAENMADAIGNKIDGVMKSVTSLTSSSEWKNAETLWEKVQVAWDKLVAEPFDKWWSGKGKTWLTGKANDIGQGLGTALKEGILGLLGLEPGSAVEDGMSIGKSFMDGFLSGFDAKKVAEAVWKGLKDVFKDAAKLLPGGEDATSTSKLSAGLIGMGAFKIGKTAYKAYKGGKAIVNGIKGVGSAIGNVTGISQGMHVAGMGMGDAALETGSLGLGGRIGVRLAGAGSGIAKAAAKAAPVAAGIGSAVQIGLDAYKGAGKAKEWTGSDSIGHKAASGIGAAIGGTGNGIFGKESMAKKAADIGGGALKGAGIGAAIGSIIPGAGTAAGAGIGAAVGAAGAAIGGSNIAKALSKAGEAIGGFFTETVPEKFGEFAEGAKGFFTESVPQALSAVGSKVSGFFTETVPAKWDEFIAGVQNFFTEQVPYALGYAAGKIAVFFTETVPEKFDELVTGIGNFFTETVPGAMSAAGSTLYAFFTETVPAFFGNLWDGITGFFTETVPGAMTAVGASLSTFFTETVPTFFTQMWDGITGFFTETVPNAIETVGQAVHTFFTETVPGFFRNLWSGITGFFTEAVPNAIASVGEGISGFFGSIKEKVSGFFSGLASKVTGFLSGASESAGAGYSAATEKHAEGGIMTSPHIGLVAEDGAEAIIPLSGKRRNRGIDLWEKAGQMLGVKPYAEGGIAGNIQTVLAAKNQEGPSAEEIIPIAGTGALQASAGSSMNIPVTIQNVTFEINVSGGEAPDAQSLVAVIRENIRGMTDEIAYQLALSLQQAFANTPTAAWEV